MTTANQLRTAIKTCAKRVTENEPNTDLRAKLFVARLSGSMEILGETELDQILWALLGHQVASNGAPINSPEAPRSA